MPNGIRYKRPFSDPAYDARAFDRQKICSQLDLRSLPGKDAPYRY